MLGCSSPEDEQSREHLKQWMAPNGKIKVLSTTAIINDIVQQISGDHVDTLTLIQGELDPHSYQLVKGDDEKLSTAQIIFYNGLGLEHGPSLRSYLDQSSKAKGLGDEVRKEDPSVILTVDGSVDPHLWMDVSLWAQIVPHIVSSLSEHDPEHAVEYRQRGELVQAKMLEKHRHLKSDMARVPPEQRYLTTSHDAFNYFARAYMAVDGEQDWQKRFMAPEGLAPDSQLNPADIRLILDHLKQVRVHVIFPESNVSQSSIRKLIDAGKELGLNLCIVPEPLYSDALGRPGSQGDTYLKMVEYNVRTISKYLIKDSCDE